jgi:hypothetical protein
VLRLIKLYHCTSTTVAALDFNLLSPLRWSILSLGVGVLVGIARRLLEFGINPNVLSNRIVITGEHW